MENRIEIIDDVGFINSVGVFFLLISFIILFIGIISPTACGSGDCLSSIYFYILCLCLSILGLILIIFDLLLKEQIK